MSNQTMKIEFKSEGFRQILNSGGVQGAVASAAEAIQARANANLQENSEGFSSHVWQGGYGGGRWIGSVNTTDHASMVAEAEEKALSRAVTG